MTRKGTAVTVYGDGGVVIATGTTGSGSFTSTALALGQNRSTTPGSDLFAGDIADVSVWFRCLTAAEVALDYAESRNGYPEALRRFVRRKTWFLADVPARVDAPYGVTQPTVPRDLVDPAQPMDAGHYLNGANLLAWLYGVKNSGWTGGKTFPNIVQGSRYAHPHTLTNGPGWVDSRYGRAVKLVPGSLQYIDAGTVDAHLTGETKVVGSMWVNRTAATHASMFRGNNSVDGFGLIWFNDNNIYGVADRGSGVGSGFVYAASTATGWNHVQFAYDGAQSTNATKMRLWLNGKPLSLTTSGTVATSVVACSLPWSIGKFNSVGTTYYGTGGVADHRLFTGRVWSDADAAALYKESCAGNPGAINWLGRSSWTQTPGALSPITGDAALTQGIFALSATGTVAVAGASALTQAAQTLAAAGAVSVAGAAAITQAADTAAGTGAVAVAGATSQTQAADTSAAAGAVSIAGAAAVTQGADTLASAGTLTVTGGAALTQAGDATSGTGAVSIVGGAGITEAGQTLASAGAVAITGSAALTQAGQTLYSTGGYPTAPVPGGIFRRPEWSWARTFRRVPATWRRVFARPAWSWSRVFRYCPMSQITITPTVLTKPVSEDRWMAFDLSTSPEAVAGESFDNPEVLDDDGLTLADIQINATAFDEIAAGKAILVLVSGGSAGSRYDVAVRVEASGGSRPVLNGRVVVTPDA